MPPPRRARPSGAARRLLLLLPALGLWVLTGCSLLQPRADPARFYVLTAPGARAQPGPEGQTRRWKVGLRPVEAPAYLRSRAIVVRTGANEVQLADFDRWAEPLEQGIARVVQETLRSARNVESVTADSHRAGPLDWEVTIRILACEGVRAPGAECSVRFTAAWETRAAGNEAPPAKRGVFAWPPAAWNGQDYGQLAGRLSQAAADLGQALAATLPTEPAPPLKTAPK